ncbi:hypothetical protein S40293_08679 [Stachybotrys chartarum IBT 40293]|nr:hypothetical protein S40293_08679 [Stachybotrys chartarum IBT 40293]
MQESEEANQARSWLSSVFIFFWTQQLPTLDNVSSSHRHKTLQDCRRLEMNAESPIRRPKSKVKVKTGCRTCNRGPSPAYILEMGDQGAPYFEWFKCRTAIKLPASFRSGFWDQLVFQAVQSEPAVLHAVLALSCLHMDGHSDTCGYRNTICRARQGDRLVLQYYVKAIEHLQPHFNAQADRSFRVTLMTCLIFACIDLLRSHFDTARSHVGNALQLLRQAGLVVEQENGNLHPKTDINQTDTWIIETCGRLQFQLELFTYSPQLSRSCLLFPTTPEQAFLSVNGAWLHLECIFKQIFQHGRDMDASIQCKTTSCQQLSLLIEKEQNIQSELLRWQTKLEAFRETLPHPLTATAQKCFHLLQVYHTLANVMAQTYQKPSDQSTYDAYAEKFALLLHQIIKLQEMCGSAMFRQQVRDRHLLNMSRTVIDLGSVAPLYYVAANCRVSHIRSRALDVLERSTHREGFWDSGVSATVGRKLLEIEGKEVFSETIYGKQRDDTVPFIPENCRVHEPDSRLVSVTTTAAAMAVAGPVRMRVASMRGPMMPVPAMSSRARMMAALRLVMMLSRAPRAAVFLSGPGNNVVDVNSGAEHPHCNFSFGQRASIGSGRTRKKAAHDDQFERRKALTLLDM